MGEVYISDPKQVANILGQHFASVTSASHYSPEFQQTRRNTVIVPPQSNNTESYNLPFTMKEMENAISQSSMTSPGEDEIRYEMISHLPDCSKVFLLNTLNGFWKFHTYPSSWKIEIVIACLKAGKNPELPQSYRPIALTSCVCKLFERMANNRLMWILESRKLLTNRQFGFRKNKCTLDPLSMLTREIQNAMAIQNQTVGVFFDLEKAYDTIWRGGILQQLVSWGIGGNLFVFIQDFLSDRYIKVRVGSQYSNAYLQEEGVPQGSVLSVTLFAIAINSIMESVPPGVQGTLFVDDFAIYCSASTALEACRKLQTTINSVTKWADSKGFKFSSQKTKAIRFTRTRKVEEIPTLFLKDEILPYEDQIKFLGVILDEKLTFSAHINDLCIRVKKSLNILKVVSHTDWGADRTMLLRLYTSLCLSKIDYASQVYGCAVKTNLEKLDVVHNLGLRICTGAYRTSPVDSIYVDSGIPPLSIHRKELGLGYITKIKTSKENPNYRYVNNPSNRSPNKPRIPKPLEVRLEREMRTVEISTEQIACLDTAKFPPWCRPSIDVCPIEQGKKNRTEGEVRSEFLNHISKHKNKKAIYTDGSKSAEGVGVAIVTENTTIMRKLSNLCSIFTAEVYAILVAVRFIFSSGESNNNIVIYSDSLSVLLAIKQLYPNHQLIKEVQDWLALLYTRNRVKVDFCWVPAHVGIVGNERADNAAKEAALSQSVTNIPIQHNDFKEKIHKFCRDEWQDRWSSLTTNQKLKSIRTTVKKWNHPRMRRRESIVLMKLRIGHTHLTHSFIFKSGDERQVPYCDTCRTDVTVRHLLTECHRFNCERRRNLLHGRSMEEFLAEDGLFDRVLNFLKQINLFYDI